MLKPILLATSMLFAVPAFAQDTKPQDNTQQTTSTPEQAATPATDDQAQDQATAAQATPQAAPATAPADQTAQQPTAPAQPAPGVAQTAPTAPAQPEQAAASTMPAAQPAATQEQVAQAVGRDFGTYDKDADGKLDKTEFTAWMGTLRKAAEPSFEPGSAEATTWASQAFTTADKDRNAAVNKQELTVFLTPQPS